jgi:hypothetical protein
MRDEMAMRIGMRLARTTGAPSPEKRAGKALIKKK